MKDLGTVNDGKSVDVDGNAGTYEYLSLSLDYQFMHDAEEGYNLLGYIGYGGRSAYLDTTYDDKLNHKGELAKIGLRYDQDIEASDNSVFATLEYRHYWDTDDINPANDEGTSFDIINVKGAWMWQTSSSFSPVVELIYSTDLDGYNAVSVAPEFVYTVNSTLDIKLTTPIGITNDADKYGVRLGLTTHF